VLAIGTLVVMITQPQIYVVLSSIGIVLIYGSYLLVTGPMLRQRLRARWPLPSRTGSEYWLGRWGVLANAIAVVWGASMMINLMWPRNEVYNPVAPFHWYLKWSGVLVLLILVIGGLLVYRLRIRHRSGVLAEHALLAPAAVISQQPHRPAGHLSGEFGSDRTTPSAAARG
jgi:hypothetical protein